MSGAGHLGITVGNTRSVAVHRMSADAEPSIVVLPTTLRFDDDGRAHLGEPTEQAPFTRFVDLVGKQDEPDPGAYVYRAEDLMANAANCLVTSVSASAGGTPVTTMTYPARWQRESVALLRDALDHAGLTEVAIVPDAKAAGAFARTAPGETTTVIDIGATGTDISMHPGGGTVRTTAVGGDVFTDVLFDHVVTGREQIDLSDPAAPAALAGVVDVCEEAKIALSGEDTATLTIELPGLSTTTTVTRTEFGALVEPAVREHILPAIDRQTTSGTVVVTGGGAEIEAVATAIDRHVGGHLVVDPFAVTRGALLLAEIEDIEGNSLVTGAAPIVTRNDGADSVDTDAIPVVAPERSLAFSEAIPAVAPLFEPSELRPEPMESIYQTPDTGPAGLTPTLAGAPQQAGRSERSKTITTIVGGAAAGVVIVLAIAALSGVFGSEPATTPPAVTDAGSPVVTSTVAPVTPDATTEAAVVVPVEPQQPTYETYTSPEPAPLPPPPAPEPAPLPEPTTVEPTTTPAPTTPVETTTVTATPTTTTTTPAPPAGPGVP